jgi:hypothetical protein
VKNIEGRLAKLETVAPPPPSAPCHPLIDRLIHHLVGLSLPVKKELRDCAREAERRGVDMIEVVTVARAEQILADVEAADSPKMGKSDV